MNPKGSGREEGKEEKMSLYRHFYKEGIKWPTLKEAGHYCKLGKAKHVRVLHTHYNGWRHSQPSAEDAENQDPSELLGRQREAATPANRMAVPQQLT